MVHLGYPRPSLAGIGVPWVLTGTHRCALMPRVASRQSANPLWLVKWRSHVVLDVVGEMCCREHSVGTENTYKKSLILKKKSGKFFQKKKRKLQKLNKSNENVGEARST